LQSGLIREPSFCVSMRHTTTKLTHEFSSYRQALPACKPYFPCFDSHMHTNIHRKHIRVTETERQGREGLGKGANGGQKPAASSRRECEAFQLMGESKDWRQRVGGRVALTRESADSAYIICDKTPPSHFPSCRYFTTLPLTHSYTLYRTDQICIVCPQRFNI
ncbi:hypothetical protein J6590_029085, partial [Homalodisca vitripennis]